MLLDEVNLVLRGGHGGPGKVSFFPGKKAGPDGGSGGRGGDLYLRVTSDLTALNQFSQKKDFMAEAGKAGDSNKKSGRAGGDLELVLPLGSELVDKDSGEVFRLDNLNLKVMVAKGGLGGRGNAELASSRRTTPEFAQPGLPGQERRFSVQLKMLADFGLIGLPNAGKSSLINVLTAARSKVGAYAFTTTDPVLGAYKNKIIVDIPGLIEGAAEGKGMGVRFLKHIEKVKLLLHCITADSDDVVRDYKTVMTELEKFNPELVAKPQVILLTKVDLIAPDVVDLQLKQLKGIKKEILPVSIYQPDSINPLGELLSRVA